MEAYIASRTGALRIPQDIPGKSGRLFNVSRIEVAVRSCKRVAILRAVRGGFMIMTRIPKSQWRHLCIVVAHELAHTFFYEFRGQHLVPTHRPHPYEEALCDYGARALLIPRTKIPEEAFERCSLDDIISISKSLDAYPHWVATRLFVDLEAREGAFFVYRSTPLGFEKHPNRETVTDGCRLDRTMLFSLRRLIAEHASDRRFSVDRVHLGKAGRGGCFTVEGREVDDESSSMFAQGRAFHVLVQVSR